MVSSTRSRDKAESELAEHVKKAVNSQETAPKQKHVRRFGYGPLIAAYVEYLLAKLEFHRVHPEFTGNFDYEEYLSLKGISDLNEGYTTVIELLDLHAKLDAFQSLLFDQFRPTDHNECRIAALVPMVEESHGLYKFATSMITALHLCVESADPLIPLVERYQQMFAQLKRFYQHCSALRYLTSLVAIPQLPDECPHFIVDFGGTTIKHNFKISDPKITSPPPIVTSPPPPPPAAAPVEFDLLGDEIISSSPPPTSRPLRSLSSAAGASYRDMSVVQKTVQTVAVPVAVQDQGMMQQMQQLQAQLQAALWRHQQDQQLIAQYHDQLTELQRAKELSELRIRETDRGSLGQVRQLQEEVTQWKSRYEGMSRLYQQLREEHLAALQKLDQIPAASNTTDLLVDEAEDPFKDQEVADDDRLGQELLKAGEAIERAALRLADLSGVSEFHLPPNLHRMIVERAAGMTTAIGNLIKHAIAAQQEILSQQGNKAQPESFYRQHSEWTNGLISAAHAVAHATLFLVDTADGVLKGSHTLEQLQVASNAVAAATVQLVAASRVKAVPRSVAQPLLESSARLVKEANNRLVQVTAEQLSDTEEEYTHEYGNLNAVKIADFNKQVEILELEAKLQKARSEQARIRRTQYENSPVILNAADKDDEVTEEASDAAEEVAKEVTEDAEEDDFFDLQKP